METGRITFPVLLMLCFAGATLQGGETRTWTDSSGKTMTGELLHVTTDGKAVIFSNGKTFDIPIARFSEADQQVIRSQKEANPADSPQKESETPSRRPRRGGEDDLFDHRDWTDAQGNTIRARYVRMHMGQVVLLQGNRPHQVPFDKLSDADQAYLRGALEKRGEADLIPAPIQNDPAALGGEDNPSMVGEPGESGGSRFPAPSFPTPTQSDSSDSKPVYDPPSKPAYDPSKPIEDQMASSSDDSGSKFPSPTSFPEPDESPQLASNSLRGPSFPTKAPEMNLPEEATNPELLREKHREHRRQNAEFYEQFTSAVCSGCNKEVPDHLGAGDHCPHCGVFFEYEENAAGDRIEAPWYKKISWIGIAVAIIGTAIRFGIKAVWR